VVTINLQTKEITRSGQYWAFAHFSRVIRRGARRFDSQSLAFSREHVALENPDGQKSAGCYQSRTQEDDRTSPVGSGGLGSPEGNVGYYVGSEVSAGLEVRIVPRPLAPLALTLLSSINLLFEVG
jgi:hypothetical protein